ncbi:hypothetical protein EKO27_g2010 [Xylaria grammica]|uniref:DUF8021 domain-containing protein n=1 Tax=Xylaria grammica TaxID=363999 RepID=A0A439DFB0_9PEZI|nr:hypothetical protein EKO27_g2010 [Xylaria grammica]
MMMYSIILAGAGFAAQAAAACSRAALQEVAAAYVRAQADGKPTLLSLATNTSYAENDKPLDIAKGVLSQPITIDFNRSIYDTTQCATFTELTAATSKHPYVIATRILLDDDASKITKIESVVTDSGDWAFNATGHLYWTRQEKWEPIPEAQRDTRAAIQAAGDAYLNQWGNSTLPVPLGTPCTRLEGGAYTGQSNPSANTCRMGAFPQPLKVGDRRYIIDEELGAVDIFNGFPWLEATKPDGSVPSTNFIRVERGLIRYIHELTVLNEALVKRQQLFPLVHVYFRDDPAKLSYHADSNAAVGTELPYQAAEKLGKSAKINDVATGRRPEGYPPGPPTLPLIGNLHLMPKQKGHLQFERWANEYGPIYSLILGTQVMVVISSDKVVKDLLDKRSGIYSSRPDMYLSQDIEYGETWRMSRGIFHRGLNIATSRAYIPYQELESRAMLLGFLGQPSEFFNHIRRYTNSTMTQVIFGFRTVDIHDPNLQQLVDPCIASEIVRAQDELGFSDSRAGYLNGTILEAGSDTSASTLIGFVQAMLIFPEVSKLAQAEIDDVCGDRIPSLDDLPDLPYIRGCVKESMRWMPTAMLGLPHATIRDDEYLGYKIPKGAAVVLNVWAIHNDASRYPEPRRFDPSRWAHDSQTSAESANNQDPSKRDQFAFGAGRRICQGIHIADRALFLGISRLLWAFDFQRPVDPSTGEEIVPDMEDLDEGLLACPNPFGADIKPRSASRAEAIRAEWNKMAELLDGDLQWKEVPEGVVGGDYVPDETKADL